MQPVPTAKKKHLAAVWPLAAGSVPTSWSSQLPGSAGVSILPQGTKGGLCGAVPSSPVLLVTPQDGAFYQASNSLGSCLQSQCSGQKIVSE